MRVCQYRCNPKTVFPLISRQTKLTRARLNQNRKLRWVMDTQVKKAIIPDMVREMMEIVLWAHSDEGKNKEALAGLQLFKTWETPLL